MGNAGSSPRLGTPYTIAVEQGNQGAAAAMEKHPRHTQPSQEDKARMELEGIIVSLIDKLVSETDKAEQRKLAIESVQLSEGIELTKEELEAYVAELLDLPVTVLA